MVIAPQQALSCRGYLLLLALFRQVAALQTVLQSTRLGQILDLLVWFM